MHWGAGAHFGLLRAWRESEGINGLLILIMVHTANARMGLLFSFSKHSVEGRAFCVGPWCVLARVVFSCIA